VYKEQLMALGIVPGDLDLAAKAFPDLKAELDKEKAAQETTQIEVDMLSWVVKDLKTSVDKFAAQISTLEDKVKHLENKVVDGLNEVREPRNSAWSAPLWLTTTTKSKTLN
jgi:uncharacterized coiled-coil protein SlyX